MSAEVARVVSPCLTVVLPPGSDQPPLGEVSVPVNGGQGWLDLFHVRVVYERHDGHIVALVEPAEGTTWGQPPG